MVLRLFFYLRGSDKNKQWFCGDFVGGGEAGGSGGAPGS